MGDITQSDQGEERTVKATAAENSKTFRSGVSDNTSSTVPELERLKSLSRDEALREVCEELANLLVVYQNLGGAITAISLPPGREILAHRHILALPAKKAEDGSFSLSVPE